MQQNQSLLFYSLVMVMQLRHQKKSKRRVWEVIVRKCQTDNTAKALSGEYS